MEFDFSDERSISRRLSTDDDDDDDASSSSEDDEDEGEETTEEEESDDDDDSDESSTTEDDDEDTSRDDNETSEDGGDGKEADLSEPIIDSPSAPNSSTNQDHDFMQSSKATTFCDKNENEDDYAKDSHDDDDHYAKHILELTDPRNHHDESITVCRRPLSEKSLEPTTAPLTPTSFVVRRQQCKNDNIDSLKDDKEDAAVSLDPSMPRPEQDKKTEDHPLDCSKEQKDNESGQADSQPTAQNVYHFETPGAYAVMGSGRRALDGSMHRTSDDDDDRRLHVTTSASTVNTTTVGLPPASSQEEPQEPEASPFVMRDDLLIVAEAVDGESQEVLGRAVQVDASSSATAAAKQLQIKRRKRAWSLGAAFGFLFLVVVPVVLLVVGVFVLPSDKKSVSQNSNKNHPEIRALVESLVGRDALDNIHSPYSKALDWIQQHEAEESDPADRGFLQRYIAAYFYFATSVDQPWLSCNPPAVTGGDSACVLPDRNPNIASLGNHAAIRWLSKERTCYWVGIFCDPQGQIRDIVLEGNELAGPFPEGLKHLRFLHHLELTFSQLRGTLPPSAMDAMKHLDTMDLDYNEFTGTIPMEWMHGKSLKHITMSYNQLTGTIPSEIENMMDARVIDFDANALTGSVPDGMGKLSSLHHLRLDRNSLTGSIPTWIGGMSILIELSLGRNRLTGSVPKEVVPGSRLKVIRINDNPQLSGEIPASLWNATITHLWHLHIQGCKFSGTLDFTAASLLSGQNQDDDLLTLESIKLSQNRFEGSIPTELGLMTGLTEVWVHGNDFVGSMPAEICSLQSLRFLLDDVWADCLPDAVTGDVKLACDASCCRMCCEKNGTRCLETSGRGGTG